MLEGLNSGMLEPGQNLALLQKPGPERMTRNAMLEQLIGDALLDLAVGALRQKTSPTPLRPRTCSSR